MDLLSLLIGLIIGAAIAGFLGWKIGKQVSETKNSQLTTTENEIKQLITQQAKQHIETTKSAVENMQTQLSAIQEQLAGFETGLHNEQIGSSDQTFYGEHASAFLRNTTADSPKSTKSTSAENQPLDFPNQASGLFVDKKTTEKE